MRTRTRSADTDDAWPAEREEQQALRDAEDDGWDRLSEVDV